MKISCNTALQVCGDISFKAIFGSTAQIYEDISNDSCVLRAPGELTFNTDGKIIFKCTSLENHRPSGNSAELRMKCSFYDGPWSQYGPTGKLLYQNVYLLGELKAGDLFKSYDIDFFDKQIPAIVEETKSVASWLYWVLS